MHNKVMELGNMIKTPKESERKKKPFATIFGIVKSLSAIILAVFIEKTLMYGNKNVSATFAVATYQRKKRRDKKIRRTI